MQDLTKSLILLNGELKTFQIASISKLDANVFRVSFKNSPKSYTYSADKVVWLTNPQWLVPELCKVYRGGRLQTDVKEIWQFEAGQSVYWRIKYRSGYEGEYTDGYTTFSTIAPQQSNSTPSTSLPSIEHQEAKASAMSIVSLSKSCCHKNS